MRLSRAGVAMAALLVFSSTIAIGQGGQAGQGGQGAQPAQGGQGGRGGAGRGGGGRGGRGAETQLPVPRRPDGRPLLGAEPGKTGLWHGGFTITGSDIPYQPWARAVAEVRERDKLEPHARCKPSGAVRQFQTPYGVDIVELPEHNLVYLMDVGGPHTFRIVYTDGRPHPKNLTPTYYGHSVGHWEGDTFVIDTVGYNEKFWIDRGDSPNTGFVHTEQLHTIERLTRTSFNTIVYELTIDDPGAYTRTWTANPYNISLRSDEELFEYICQDNNFGAELMVGESESIDRTSRIVP